MARAGLGCAPRSLQATTHARSARLLGLLGVLAVAFGGGCRRFPRHLHDRGPPDGRVDTRARARAFGRRRDEREPRATKPNPRARESPRERRGATPRAEHTACGSISNRGRKGGCAYLARRSGETERASVRNQSSDALTRARDALFLTRLWIDTPTTKSSSTSLSVPPPLCHRRGLHPAHGGAHRDPYKRDRGAQRYFRRHRQTDGSRERFR